MRAEVDVLKSLFSEINKKVTTVEKELGEQKLENAKLNEEVKQLNEYNEYLEDSFNHMKDQVKRPIEQNSRKDKLQNCYKILKDEVRQLKSTKNAQLENLEKCYSLSEEKLQQVIKEQKESQKIILELSEEFKAFKETIEEENPADSEKKVQFIENFDSTA